MQAAGEERHFHVLRLAERIAHGINIAAPCADHELAVGQHGDAARFQHHIRRQRDTRELVIIILLRRSLSRKAGDQQAGENCEFFIINLRF